MVLGGPVVAAFGCVSIICISRSMVFICFFLHVRLVNLRYFQYDSIHIKVFAP